MTDYTPYQQRVIKKYYENLDNIKLTRLANLVSELYLTTGKKQERLWQQAASAMQQLGVPASRIEHLLRQRRPELLAQLVQELEGRR
jgi:hypothetical protein